MTAIIDWMKQFLILYLVLTILIQLFIGYYFAVGTDYTRAETGWRRR